MKNILNKLKKHQFFWDVAEKLAGFYSRSSFNKLPHSIFVELTNSCFLKCPVCSTNFAMKRKRGFMDFDLYKSIIDEFKDSNQKPVITMNFAGEPLLHKKVVEFVEYATKNGHETFISTNAVLLSKDLSKRLIKAGLKRIHLCLDGFTKESHEAYRRGSDFGITKRNIEEFIITKKELNNKTSCAIIQTLLTSFSENEVEDIIKWAQNIGADAINLKTLSMGSHTSEEMKREYSYLLPRKKEFRRKVSQLNKTLCSVPMTSAVVYWNGEIGLCCIDYDNEIKMGNVKEKGFLNTFFSEEVMYKRKLGFQKKFDLCKRCSLSDADFMGMNIDFDKQNL